MKIAYVDEQKSDRELQLYIYYDSKLLAPSVYFAYPV